MRLNADIELVHLSIEGSQVDGSLRLTGRSVGRAGYRRFLRPPLPASRDSCATRSTRFCSEKQMVLPRRVCGIAPARACVLSQFGVFRPLSRAEACAGL